MKSQLTAFFDVILISGFVKTKPTRADKLLKIASEFDHVIKHL